MPAIPNPWTDAMRAVLRLMRRDPAFTYRDICNHINATFSTQVTRNACIGMSRRMSIVQVLPPVDQWLPPPPKPATPRPPPPPRAPFTMTIYELTEKTCKWPEGNDPPFMYCGCKTVSGSPYCVEHTRISYPNRPRS